VLVLTASFTFTSKEEEGKSPQSGHISPTSQLNPLSYLHPDSSSYTHVPILVSFYHLYLFSSFFSVCYLYRPPSPFQSVRMSRLAGTVSQVKLALSREETLFEQGIRD
jgi:hypothetical protein